MNISIILAAGEGSRMKSKTSKVLHKVCERPILEYIIRASQDAGIEKNIVVVGHGGDQVREYFEEDSIIFKSQPTGEDAPYGTGFAVMQAIEYIEDDSNVIILCGDTPLIRDRTIRQLLDYHRENNFHGTILTALLDNPTGYGRILRRESGDIVKIVEEKDANEEEKNIKEVNSGIFCFKGKFLKDALARISDDNAQGEYYITDVIEILVRDQYRIGGCLIQDNDEIHGVNSRVQLALCQEIMKDRINHFHMENGVTLIDPKNTYIGRDVKIHKDTIIYPGVFLEGDSFIGEECIIRQHTRIVNSRIGDRVSIESSTIEDSFVDEDCQIGPYAHLRPDCVIGKNVRLGNFVEVKNSTIKDGSKAGHLAYIGDAEVGHNVNIGCGVVFVNYTGKEKFRTSVGDNAFIGSNANLVAPLTVNAWGYVAAGSTITKEVPEDSLSISRGQQRNIEGWVEKKGYKK